MFVDVINMFDLEKDLPDELMSGGSWGMPDNMGNSKPPAQGPGPGQMQNGIDTDAPNSLRQMQQIHSHMLQVRSCFLVFFSQNVQKFRFG